MKRGRNNEKRRKRLKKFFRIFFLTTAFLTFYYITTIAFGWVEPRGHPPKENVSFGDFCQKVYGGCPAARCMHPCATVPIGGTCGGGKVAYHSGNSSGFIARTEDDSHFWGTEWGCSGKSVEGTLAGLGTGLANTNAIVAFHNDPSNFNGNNYYSFGGDYSTIGCHVDNNGGQVAAKVCADLSSGGYDDWYLPSRWELFQLYVNNSVIGGFTMSGHYWSSTQVSTGNAWVVDFADGNHRSGVGSWKIDGYRIRCIRAF